ncbi:DNA/RNA nuclease SfsA [Breznakiella homolactica]|uniref:DNA/RNA nuclease SfsA n=1 Tax=Breznakiella homolactica TaxID=2798577 RepID=A0A7T8B964_9SPIR|nr:DNA/RNA nuclease SfsA [Breznakiella homolactica]QQO09319.1 DNA/RNA nuclease SfsA [Breznakiella homolactica]
MTSGSSTASGSARKSIQLFRNDREAFFARRPNRFLILADPGGTGGEIPCHCPNPGRLIEFVFPGTKLILEKRENHTDTAKTAWTAAGLYYRDAVVPLYSSRANRAAQRLILPEIIPNLTEIKPEHTIGQSRFDFLCVDRDNRQHLVEVKACSLVEYGTAMFPDAPSARAAKHLAELAELSARGFVCHVLFVIVHGNPSVFIPNLHTDPAFAAAVSRYSDSVHIHAALLKCDSRGTAVLEKSSVPADLSHGELAGQDRGNYFIALEIPEKTSIPVGALGILEFEKGWYVYAGSAQKNLSRRIARHLRKVRKQKHWHLDYLTPEAKTIKAFPVCSYRNLECVMAEELRRLGGIPVSGFGCSDCRCGSHLYRFSAPPLSNRGFVDMLLRLRHRDGLQRP